MTTASFHGRRTALVLLTAACLGAHSAAALAHPHPTQADAVAMTEKAAAFLETHGTAKLIERVNAKDLEFCDGELYLVVLQLDGTHLAHPVNAKLIGKSLLDLPDTNGKMFRRERVALAASQGKGWVDYKYKNPKTGRTEQKTAYVLKAAEVLLSVGVYKD
ncbi:MAG: cache domain-containing protein [Pseudomonadota bacterium]